MKRVHLHSAIAARAAASAADRAAVRDAAPSGTISADGYLSLLERPAHHDLGQPGETAVLGAHDLPRASSRGSSDDQVVGAARAAAAAGVGKQRRVLPGDVEVISLGRDSLEHRGDECLASRSPFRVRQLDAHKQLRRGDRGDRNVVGVADQPIERRHLTALGVDQHRGVEDQARQGSVPGPTLSRSSRSSAAHSVSGRFFSSASFSERPVPPSAGPIVATTRPWRTTTNDSPSDSTLSSTSENRRAASVALSCLIKSDYQTLLFTTPTDARIPRLPANSVSNEGDISRLRRSDPKMSILLSKDTTFIVQGITGREAVNLTRECLDYGSEVVGGVTPGRKGREVHGVPVFDTVAQAVESYGGPIDGSVVTVPPAFTKDAVFEAIENGIGLIVIVTERIPRRDVAQMVELAEMRGARIIGPNCLGLIVPGVCKMGGIGGPAKDAAKAYAPGPVGVMSRSGGMTTEISSSLTQAGLGVSTAVSIGGDAIIGSTYAELMPYFEADEQTKAIVIYTEPGGRMEAQLSAWVKENDSRLPIIAFMAGKFMDDEEMKGMSFGHAGTIVEGAEDTATEKIARLEAAGIRVVERIDEIPDAVKEKLGVAA